MQGEEEGVARGSYGAQVGEAVEAPEVDIADGCSAAQLPTLGGYGQEDGRVVVGDTGIAIDSARPPMRRHIPAPERRVTLWAQAVRARAQQGPLAGDYLALWNAETCLLRAYGGPAVRERVADMAARIRRRTLPELHHFSRRLGVPA
ncbi:hypothetical protein [Streptomyces goshikiensis]|uniref:hypothetical protein n=1 Tax=Streptomyces goshikiensis TaxID=1942 RepID=UPI003712F956